MGGVVGLKSFHYHLVSFLAHGVAHDALPPISRPRFFLFFFLFFFFFSLLSHSVSRRRSISIRCEYFKKRGETLNNELSYRFLSTLLIFKKCVRIENRQGLKQIEERNCIVHFHSNFFRSYRNRRQQYPLNFFYSSHCRGNFNSQRQINFPPLSLDNPPVIFLPWMKEQSNS